MRDSVVFYRSFYEAIKDLPPEDFKKSVKAIMEYGLNEIEPDTNGIEKTIFLLTKPQIDANNKRYQNGTKGGRPVTEGKPNHNQTITKTEPKVKEKVKEKDKEKENNRVVRFAPPTLENVSGYCQEKGYDVDAERFIDFYESKGWMVGKNKMKDWKAAVRNWARQEKQEGNGKESNQTRTKTTGFSNFEQRDYDFDELEKQLLDSQGE